VLYSQEGSTTATQNGASMACNNTTSSGIRTNKQGYCYLANPSSGTLTVNSNNDFMYEVFTVKDADQINPIDAFGVNKNTSNVTTDSVNVTTNSGSDFLVGWVDVGNTSQTFTHGGSQTEVAVETSGGAVNPGTSSYKAAGASPATETLTES